MTLAELMEQLDNLAQVHGTDIDVRIELSDMNLPLGSVEYYEQEEDEDGNVVRLEFIGVTDY